MINQHAICSFLNDHDRRRTPRLFEPLTKISAVGDVFACACGVAGSSKYFWTPTQCRRCHEMAEAAKSKTCADCGGKMVPGHGLCEDCAAKRAGHKGAIDAYRKADKCTTMTTYCEKAASPTLSASGTPSSPTIPPAPAGSSRVVEVGDLISDSYGQQLRVSFIRDGCAWDCESKSLLQIRSAKIIEKGQANK